MRLCVYRYYFLDNVITTEVIFYIVKCYSRRDYLDDSSNSSSSDLKHLLYTWRYINSYVLSVYKIIYTAEVIRRRSSGRSSRITNDMHWSPRGTIRLIINSYVLGLPLVGASLSFAQHYVFFRVVDRGVCMDVRSSSVSWRNTEFEGLCPVDQHGGASPLQSFVSETVNECIRVSSRSASCTSREDMEVTSLNRTRVHSATLTTLWAAARAQWACHSASSRKTSAISSRSTGRLVADTFNGVGFSSRLQLLSCAFFLARILPMISSHCQWL